MAQKILGLDLGAHAVKAVVLEASFRGFTVVDCDEERLPSAVEGDPPQQALLAALSTLLARHPGLARTELSAVAVPGADAASPLLTLPFVDLRKIDATLPFEVEGQIPVDLDEVVYDHQVLAQRDGKSELLVGVTRREAVQQLLQGLHSIGVDPRVVTLPELALHQLLAGILARHPIAAEESVAVADLGHARTTLLVATPPPNPAEKSLPVITLCRTFAAGGADLTRALEREYEVPRAEAEAWKERQGDVSDVPADPRAAAALQRGLQPLVRELRQSLRAAQTRSRRPVNTLWLVGGTAQLRGLSARLSRELGVRTEVLSALPSESGSPASAGRAPSFALGFGLALRAQSRAGRLLNLRKGELAFKGDLDYLKGKVARLAAFAAVLVALLGANLWAQGFMLRQTDAKLNEALCDTTTKVLGKCEEDFNVAISKLEGGDRPSGGIPTASALEILVETTQRVPADLPVKLQEVDVSLQKVRMKGVVDSFDGVDQLVAGLKQSRCFGDVKRGKVQKNKDEKIEFTLDVLYVCGQNADKAG